MPRRSSKAVAGSRKTGQKWPKNANDHEQRARVHPALPDYSVVVPAPERLSIDVAVRGKIGMAGTFRKGVLNPSRVYGYCGTSRITGPRTADGALSGPFAGSLLICRSGFPNCPIGPYAIAITNTADATMAPNTPATDSEFISMFPAQILPDDITKDRATGIGLKRYRLLRRCLVPDKSRRDILLRRCDGIVGCGHMRAGIDIGKLQ
jgi:hypothetical protein